MASISNRILDHYGMRELAQQQAQYESELQKQRERSYWNDPAYRQDLQQALHQLPQQPPDSIVDKKLLLLL